MNLAYEGGSLTWQSYVKGTIAFLERDKSTLEESIRTIAEQENQMNIEILEKLLKYYDRPYAEAYNQPS